MGRVLCLAIFLFTFASTSGWAYPDASSVTQTCSQVVGGAPSPSESEPPPQQNLWQKTRSFVQSTWHSLQTKVWHLGLRFTTDEKLARKLEHPPQNKRHRAILAEAMAERDFRIYEKTRAHLGLSPEQELRILEKHLQKTFTTLLADDHTRTLDQRDQAVQSELRTILHTLPTYTGWTPLQKQHLWKTLAAGLWETNPAFALEQTDAQLIIDLHRYCDESGKLSVADLARHALEPVKTAYIDGAIASRLVQITEQKEKLLSYAVELDRLTLEFWASAFQTTNPQATRREAAFYTLETLKHALSVTQNHLSTLHLDELQRLELIGIKLVADHVLNPSQRESLDRLMSAFELSASSPWERIEPWLDPLHLLELWSARGESFDLSQLRIKLSQYQNGFEQPEDARFRLREPLQAFLQRLLKDERVSTLILSDMIAIFESISVQTALAVNWDSLKKTIGKRKDVSEFLALVARHPQWFMPAPPKEFFRRFKDHEIAALKEQFPQAVESRSTSAPAPVMTFNKLLVQKFLKLHLAGLTPQYGKPINEDDLILAGLTDISPTDANSLSEQANEFYGTLGEDGLLRLENEAEAFYYANLSTKERADYLLQDYEKLRSTRIPLERTAFAEMTAAKLRKAKVKGILPIAVKRMHNRAAKLWNVPQGLSHLAKLADTPLAQAEPVPLVATPVPEHMMNFNMYLSLYESAEDVSELAHLLKHDGFTTDYLEALEYFLDPSLTSLKSVFDGLPANKKLELSFIDKEAYLRIPPEQREFLRRPPAPVADAVTVQAPSQLHKQVVRVQTFDSARVPLEITAKALAENHLPAEVIRFMEDILSSSQADKILHSIQSLNTLINNDDKDYRDIGKMMQTLITENVWDFFKSRRDQNEYVLFENWKQGQTVWTRFQKAWQDPRNPQIIRRQQVASRNGTILYSFTEEQGSYDVEIKLSQNKSGQDIGTVTVLRPHRGAVFRPEVLRQTISRMESLFLDWEQSLQGQWIDLSTNVYNGIETIEDLGFALKPSSH